MSEPTNAKVLADGLKDFALQEDFIQEEIAEYIDCPSVCPWCDEEKCIGHTTCKAIKEFAEQLRSEPEEAQS
jgi:hypothetical protein